jgi:hypothetical protein
MSRSKSVQNVDMVKKQAGSFSAGSRSDERSTSEEDVSSKTGGSRSSSDDGKDRHAYKERLGQAETNAVFRLRLAVFLVMLLAAISSLAVAIIAHGVDHRRSWPFVTLSSFQQRSSTARKLADALFVTISPIVSELNRKEWEDFVTLEDSYWM